MEELLEEEDWPEAETFDDDDDDDDGEMDLDLFGGTLSRQSPQRLKENTFTQPTRSKTGSSKR